MASPDHTTVTVLSRDTIQAGCEDAALRALDRLVEDIRLREPETLAFQVQTATDDRHGLAMGWRNVVILAVYHDVDSFFRYRDGALCAEFAAKHRQLFAAAGGSPFGSFEFLSAQAGFSREVPAPANIATSFAANRHPAVMFEISAVHQDILKDFYRQVFGWQYSIGTGQFAYVHFSGNSPPLLGGIGQSEPGKPGFGPGHRFYLLVDDLSSVIQRAVSAGGKQQMPPTSVDGYDFAIIEDPEGNPVGLIAPFNH